MYFFQFPTTTVVSLGCSVDDMEALAELGAGEFLRNAFHVHGLCSTVRDRRVVDGDRDLWIVGKCPWVPGVGRRAPVKGVVVLGRKPDLGNPGVTDVFDRPERHVPVGTDHPSSRGRQAQNPSRILS